MIVLSVIVDRLEQLIRLTKASTGTEDGLVLAKPLDRHTPNSDRSLNTTRTKLDIGGTLQTANIEILSGTLRVGQCHVRLIVEDEYQKVKATLCRGYLYPGHEVYGAGALPVKTGDYIRLDSRCSVSDIVLQPSISIKRGVEQPGGWTGTDKGSLEGNGAVRTITGTNPAAGAEISEAVPTNARWEVHSIVANLITSGTVATRQVQLVIDDGSSGNEYIYSPATQTATQNRNYVWEAGLGYEMSAFRGTSNIINQGIRSKAIMGQGYRFRTATDNLGQSDNWGAPIFTVEEWIEE